MATTSIGAISGAGSLEALGTYLRDFAEPSLVENFEVVPLCSEARVPGERGLHMYIPSYANTNASSPSTSNRGVQVTDARTSAEELGGLSEGSVLAGLRQTSVSSTSRQLTYFTDGFKFSKLYETTKTVQGSMERAAQFLMVGAAKTMDKLAQNQFLYASGTALTEADAAGTVWDKDATGGAGDGDSPGYVSATEPMFADPLGGTNKWGDIASTDYATPEGFLQARKFLRQRHCPGFAKLGGRYAAIVGPETIFRLQTQASATGLDFRRDNIDFGEAYRGAVPKWDMFGFKFFESDALTTIANGTTDQPGASGVDCEMNLLFGPDAVYVCPHEILVPQIYPSGFDEGGAFNPFKSVAALGMDYLFGAVAGPTIGERAVLMPVPV